MQPLQHLQFAGILGRPQTVRTIQPEKPLGAIMLTLKVIKAAEEQNLARL
jgi:hypothetical protein